MTATEHVDLWPRGYEPSEAPISWAAYRDAAAHEGDRYIEALRGARAMKQADYVKSGWGWEGDDSPADYEEIDFGSPWYFARVVQREWTTAPGELTEAWGK